MNVSSKSIIVVSALVGLLLVGWDSIHNSPNRRLDNTPEGVMLNYYKAIQLRDFESAYDLITPKMKGRRTRAEFVQEWNNVIKLARVQVHEFGILNSKIEGNTAVVKAWNNASDLFNPSGIIENEIDRLVRIDGVWKLDETEVMTE